MDKTQAYVDRPLQISLEAPAAEKDEYVKQLEEKFGSGFSLEKFLKR